MSTVLEMVKAELKRKDRDGLLNDDRDCACSMPDLEPCGEMESNCYAAIEVPIVNGAFDYHMAPNEEEAREKVSEQLNDMYDREVITEAQAAACLAGPKPWVTLGLLIELVNARANAIVEQARSK